MLLKELRKSKGLTQYEAANYLGISLRTYQSFETDYKKQNGFKYNYILEKIRLFGYIDENTGVLSIDKIREICINVFSNYDVSFCYLFGSYAKGYATENSDIDLLIDTSVSGLQFFDLIETLREQLKKKIDLLDIKQLENNLSLTSEILKDGIKIYG